MPNVTSQSQIAGALTLTLSLENISSFTATETLVSLASSTQLALEYQSSDAVLSAISTGTTAAYGSVVDAFDAAPAMYVAPRAHLSRDSGTLAVDGEGNYLNRTGKGYFQVRWEVAWFNTYGALVPPTWTGLTGKLFHVASGGGRRMNDSHDPTTVPDSTGWGP
ncbi:hypothetical protein DFP73DRAFT_636157 [Morchella snyderi]|nr:hypothetical protein DFP73DRAFT_636157 [Morchella snyderi]